MCYTPVLLSVPEMKGISAWLLSSTLSGGVSQFGQAIRRYAGKQRDFGSISIGCPFSGKVTVHGHCPTVTLHSTVKENLK